MSLLQHGRSPLVGLLCERVELRPGGRPRPPSAEVSRGLEVPLRRRPQVACQRHFASEPLSGVAKELLQGPPSEAPGTRTSTRCAPQPGCRCLTEAVHAAGAPRTRDAAVWPEQPARQVPGRPTLYRSSAGPQA